MGIVRMGPPEELVLILQRAFSIPYFVETGTYRGDTTRWAAGHFLKVYSVEAAEGLFESAANSLRELTNVEVLYGESRHVLPGVLRDLDGPAIFWLDGHWCGDSSFGVNDQCQLLEELAVLKDFAHDPFILVDDARLFLSPPPKPNDYAQWPTIDRVIDRIRMHDQDCYIVVFEDVVIAVPPRAKQTVAQFCQDRNTAAWQAGSHLLPLNSQPRQSSVRSPFQLATCGIKQIGLGLLRRAKKP
jgi:hypothetical protein